MKQPFDIDPVSAATATASDPLKADGASFGKLADLAARAAEETSRLTNLEPILRIPVTVQVLLGSATMPVADLMKLGRGAVIPLDHRVGEPVEVVVNGRIVARGAVVVVEDENSRFGVSLTEIVGGAAGDPDA
ncbi:flagellar motor switch protein FliN [Tardiphaga sp. 20_F10_N6_6]|jgi:flagellar motor switch protein FliN/FliY|uniref:Flagellar motor switch protein FliN n=1 Tax=Tardiphaga robiniae TaxID=943830 RepID=A0A7G6U415_9BRAD|nr:MULTISPECIES: flagellar motor switch protein FliN [Tardiphaga]NUU44761.1 flagellar motor switch protein FliN [Tardiphaga robiniae]QND73747.1 flagellar motor switch protein FliN [Tardiphaga robiniae]WNV07177.1 flagellar motor switch protein FliN [Tardiphaga sp. 709]